MIQEEVRIREQAIMRCLGVLEGLILVGIGLIDLFCYLHIK